MIREADVAVVSIMQVCSLIDTFSFIWLHKKWTLLEAFSTPFLHSLKWHHGVSWLQHFCVFVYLQWKYPWNNLIIFKNIYHCKSYIAVVAFYRFTAGELRIKYLMVRWFVLNFAIILHSSWHIHSTSTRDLWKQRRHICHFSTNGLLYNAQL